MHAALLDFVPNATFGNASCLDSGADAAALSATLPASLPKRRARGFSGDALGFVAAALNAAVASGELTARVQYHYASRRLDITRRLTDATMADAIVDSVVAETLVPTSTPTTVVPSASPTTVSPSLMPTITRAPAAVPAPAQPNTTSQHWLSLVERELIVIALFMVAVSCVVVVVWNGRVCRKSLKDGESTKDGPSNVTESPMRDRAESSNPEVRLSDVY